MAAEFSGQGLYSIMTTAMSWATHERVMGNLMFIF